MRPAQAWRGGVWAGVAFAFLPAGGLLADTVVLKSGEVIEGKVLKEREDEVIVRARGMEMTLPREEIQEIRKGEYKDPPPKPPDPPPAKPGPAPEGPARPGPEARVPGSEGPVESAVPPGAEPTLDTTPQSPRVTLDLQDRPVDEALYKIGRQSGHDVEWDGSSEQKKNLTLSLKEAPFWEAILAVCSRGGWGYTMYSQPGNPIKVPAMSSPPVRGYQVRGPVALIWHGLVQNTEFDFSQTPARPRDVEAMNLDLKLDPRCHVRLYGARTDPEFTFAIGGRRAVVKADKEMQDGMGGRAWRFVPKPELSGDRADLSVEITVWYPGPEREARLPLRAGSEAKSGDVTVALPRAVTPAGAGLSASIRLSGDPKALEEDRKAADAILAEINRAGRAPTAAESEKVQGILEGGRRLLAVGEIALIGEDGSRVAGHAGSSMSGPLAYEAAATFEPPAGFKPKEISISWTSGFRAETIPFRLEGIPLGRR